MSRATVSEFQHGLAAAGDQLISDVPWFIPLAAKNEVFAYSTPAIKGLTSHRARNNWRIFGIQGLIDRLGVCECRRRVLHMGPGLLPAILWFIPHRDPWGLPLVLTVLAVVSSIMALAMIRERDFARMNQTRWHLSVIGYGAPVLAMLFLLPGRAELGFMTLGILAFGDGSAALGGKLLGRRQLPWNRNKTWEGLFCFLFAGTVVAAFNYWVESRPAVGIGVAIVIALVAALSAAVVESLPIRSHDNLRVGVTAGLTGLGMHVFLLGW